jgi:hypothetical protein
MKNTKNKVLGALRKFKDKAVDVTSDVISAPSRMKSNMKIRKAESDTKILQEAKKYDNAPDFDGNGGVTDAFKARSLASDVRRKLKK